ncbi:MAG: four helix bundle protein [Patescibacteria group bacterium]
MNKLNHFSQLEAWKVNHEVVVLIYQVTKNFPSVERFGITDQLRRSASSVTANIAEGWGRFHYQDKLRFYYQARGSNSEVENFLLLSRDLSCLNEKEFASIREKVARGGQVLNGLIRSTEIRKQKSR